MNHAAPSNSRPARLLIVDDHGMVRDGLCILLERYAGIKVAGQAANGRDAVSAARRLRPDLILMDLVLPDLSGIDATARILARQPQTRVIVMSASSTSEHVYRALRAGARGYVVKDAMGADLVDAVRTVLADKRYLSPRIAAFLQGGLLDDARARSPMERLSAREREVLHRTVAGASSSQIAQHLSLSPKTVDTYRGRLMLKLGVSNRSALIRFAVAHGLTPF